MSEAKHTPGPWHWESDPVKGDPLGRVRYRVTTIGKTITQCYYSGHDGDQNNADARLIAAAPELLEALQITRGNIASLGPAGALAPYTCYQEWLAMVDAAIAKATGGQP